MACSKLCVAEVEALLLKGNKVSRLSKPKGGDICVFEVHDGLDDWRSDGKSFITVSVICSQEAVVVVRCSIKLAPPNIVSYISSQTSKEHLTPIILNPKLSTFNMEYEQNKKRAAGQFYLSARGYGPLTSEHSTEILSILKQFDGYMTDAGLRLLGDIENSAIAHVLLPEAIVMAIQHLLTVSRKDAEDIYLA